MLNLVIVAALIASIALSKKYPQISAVFYLGMAVLILFLRIIPGTATTLDWIFIFLMLIGSIVYFFAPKRRL